MNFPFEPNGRRQSGGPLGSLESSSWVATPGQSTFTLPAAPAAVEGVVVGRIPQARDLDWTWTPGSPVVALLEPVPGPILVVITWR